MIWNVRRRLHVDNDEVYQMVEFTDLNQSIFYHSTWHLDGLVRQLNLDWCRLQFSQLQLLINRVGDEVDTRPKVKESPLNNMVPDLIGNHREAGVLDLWGSVLQ